MASFLEDEKLQCQNGEACVGILVIAVADQQVSVIQMMERLSLKHRPTFLENYLNPAMDDGFIRQLYPQSPRHPRQKYLLTVKGFALYNKISQNR